MTVDEAPAEAASTTAGAPAERRYDGVWVVLATYNEIENIREIVPAILAALPGAHLLVVDDTSPDGTGDVADELAAKEPLIAVLHRPKKQGLGKAYIDGFQRALSAGSQIVIQMDADWSHDPRFLPQLIDALEGVGDPPGTPRPVIAIGSRYTKGGGVRGWGIMRKIVSRGGSTFARTVLRLTPHDLTGGFKAYTRETLEKMPFDELHSGGYVFQIETTFLATRHGERVVEVPIIFVDRQKGASKMSRRIIVEALIVVLQLRWEELRGKLPGSKR